MRFFHVHFCVLALLISGIGGVSFSQDFSILHTNDWQSRLLGFGPEKEYRPQEKGDGTRGGVSRVSSILKQRAAALQESGPVLILDAGDFTMGTLFHTIVREKGAELSLLSLLNYDAVGLGNHEFDFGPEGLSAMIDRSMATVGKLPPILASNMKLSESDPRDAGLREWVKKGVIRTHLVIERGGLKFGLFGLLGKSAVESIVRAGPVKFSPAVETAKEMVRFLKKELKVDVVIALSHSGVVFKDSGQWGGEEVDIVSKVPGIDVLIGGHSHTPLEQPIMVGHTPVVQAGAELQYVGELQLRKNPKEKMSFLRYQLHKIDDRIIGDANIDQLVETYKQDVQNLFLNPLGLSFDAPLAYVSKNWNRPKKQEYALGRLVALAYKQEAHADVGFVPSGVLRDDLYHGKSGIQSLSDLFRILPLGVGEMEDSTGYPLIKMHFTGKEIKSILEILLFAHKVKGEEYFPHFAGLRIVYNPNRVPLDQIMQVHVENGNGVFKEMDLSDSKTLYSVATTSYEGNFLWIIPQLSYGLLSVTPKMANGDPVKELKQTLVYSYSQTLGGPLREYKAWMALVRYIQSLPTSSESGALPHIALGRELLVELASGPATNPQGTGDSKFLQTLVAVDSFSPRALFVNATWIQWTGFGIVSFVAILSLVILMWPLVRWKRKIDRNRKGKALSFKAYRA
ncbi:MAG: bifunctional metallophosphatase/5'-nucleotidase [Oligoflexales bacterium]|nr:bifunctional metallophosphatase/5'-nucleotidase [Oligoflexales bacterium]